MICERCKTNVATIHMTEIVNGSKKEIHLCEECVEKDFILPYFKMSFAELFKNITSSDASQPAKALDSLKRKKRQVKLKRCWACESEYAEFDLFTNFGCANDYQLFSKQIDAVLRKYNNDNSVHTGKLPLRSLEKTRRENRSMLLHMRIENAVKSENYELAAKMRDKLKNL
ncbi:MAG: UvrB/UvrC motif-containing protein [Sedimentisphaeraceae bacterium JB056]